MSLGDFRSVFLPYCIRKQPDGRYAVLNRAYKPVGFFTRDIVMYEDHPVLVTIKGLTKAKAAKVSYAGSDNVDEIFLYNDWCVPTSSATNMRAYMARIEILAGLAVA